MSSIGIQRTVSGYSLATFSVFLSIVTAIVGFWLIVPLYRTLIRKRHLVKKYRLTMSLLSLATFTLTVLIPVGVVGELVKVTYGLTFHWFVTMTFAERLTDAATASCYLTIAIERLHVILKKRVHGVRGGTVWNYVLAASCLGHLPVLVVMAVGHWARCSYALQNGTDAIVNGGGVPMGCLYPVSWSLTVEGLVLFLLTTLVYVIIVCAVFHQTSRLRPVWPLQQLRKNAICAISACVPNEHHIASRHPPPVPDGRASSQRITLTTNKPLDDVIRFSFSMLAHDDAETDDSRSQPDSSVNVSRSGLNEEVTVDTSSGVPGCQIAVDGSYQTADEEESPSGKGETVDNHVCDVSCTPDDGNEVCGQGPGVGSHNLDMFLASSERASRDKRSQDSRCNLDWSRSRASLDVTMDGRLSEGSVGLQYLATKNRLGPLSAQPSAPSNTELIGHFDRNRIVEGMTFQPPWRRTRQSAHRTLRDDSYASSTDEARTRPSGSRSSVFGNDPSMTNFYSPSRSGDDKTHWLALHRSTLPREVGGRGPYWRVGTNLMKRVAVILAVVTWFTLPQIAFVLSIPHLELDVASCLYPFVNVVHRSSFLAVPHVFVHMNVQLARHLQ